MKLKNHLDLSRGSKNLKGNKNYLNKSWAVKALTSLSQPSFSFYYWAEYYSASIGVTSLFYTLILILASLQVHDKRKWKDVWKKIWDFLTIFNYTLKDSLYLCISF